jgi:hypothetical protein
MRRSTGLLRTAVRASVARVVVPSSTSMLAVTAPLPRQIVRAFTGELRAKARRVMQARRDARAM